MKILGLSAYFHDSSAALIDDGKIVAAIQEERLSRIKHDPSFPKQAIHYCLQLGQCKLSDIDAVVFFEKPLLKFDRLLDSYFHSNGRGHQFFSHTAPLWLKEKLFQSSTLKDELYQIDPSWNGNLHYSEHHRSHAGAAFFPSPFEEALILTIDGVGEWETTTVYQGKSSSIKKLQSIHYPHSLGLLYSAFTQYLGFEVNDGEYKIMGLAPYGKPLYTETILNTLCPQFSDGSFRLNISYFSFHHRLSMISKKFEKLFGEKMRQKDQPLTQFHKDIAASIQVALEKLVLALLHTLYQKYPQPNLCLAGGVALNCVLNSKIAKQTPFSHIWIQPAAGDAGSALGAALDHYYRHCPNRSIAPYDSMGYAALGRSFDHHQITTFLNSQNCSYEELDDTQLFSAIAKKISEGKVVGWFQGRSEFGPRALGNRSILADPRPAGMLQQLNAKVKRRESFRPFAPAVMEEFAAKWFDSPVINPYMLFTAQVHSSVLDTQGNSTIAAVTHVDHSARVQTVSKDSNPSFYRLIEAFYQQTATPLLLNTSFNLNKMPIVDSPQDAYDCYLQTDIDLLVLGKCVLEKK